MKNKLTLALLVANLIAMISNANIITWQKIESNHISSEGQRTLFPDKSSTFYLNASLLKPTLFSLEDNMEAAIQLDFPTPDGGMRTYKVWKTSMMEETLAKKYPEIKTFTGYATDDKSVTIKLDFTYKGFHAKVFDKANTYFIDPYSSVNDGFYTVYYKKDYPRPAGKYMSCEVGNKNTDLGMEEFQLTDTELPKIALRTNGSLKKTYRLALACTGEYAVAVAGANPSKANVMSAMTTSINRVNGVYERELAVTMTFVANNDQLIYLNGTTDPYNGNFLSENQTNVDAVIGNANYDIGHVFTNSAGGVADLSCVCSNGNKARGVTGSSSPTGDAFDIDYVAHEMGHQFGSDHTFNANSGSCSGNGAQSMAYEPGGGTTVMAYAGICGVGDNIQNNSDDYFHAISLVKITDYITTGDGGSCPATTVIANVPPFVDPFTANYSIPFLTPFELTAPTVTDNDHDVLNYCWEQWNRGDYRSSWGNPNLKGPIYRSFNPTISPTRIFVTLPQLLNNVTSYKGEKLPKDKRFLTFKLTVRDMLAGIGTFNFPDDTIHLDVINTTTPFAVKTPNTNITWEGTTTEMVTWDVSSTDLAPINTSNVDILLSTDGGNTYPIVLAANTPNDGSESIVVPNNITTTTARIKVKAVGNVFFDLSNTDFVITPFGTKVNELPKQDKIDVFPIPANNLLTIKSSYKGSLDMKIFNTLGQEVWKGAVEGQRSVSVASWSHGIYYLQFTNAKTNERVVKKIVVE